MAGTSAESTGKVGPYTVQRTPGSDLSSALSCIDPAPVRRFRPFTGGTHQPFTGTIGISLPRSYGWCTLVRPSAFRSSTGGPTVPLNGNPAAAHALGVVLAIVAIVGWLVSILCVAAAAKRAEIAPSDLRFGRAVSTTVAALFALLVAAYTMWGIGLIMQARQAARGTFTTITYSSQGLWLPMILVLFIRVALSALGARAAVRSWRMISLEII